MQKTQPSLRRKLLSWLVPLLLLLILVDSTILFKLSINKLEKELDTDLLSSAKDISRFLADFGNTPTSIHSLDNATKYFLNDEIDKILYSITDQQGQLLSGNMALQRATMTKAISTGHYFYYATIANERYRVVHAVFNIHNPQGVQTFTIQIAGTQEWRETLTNTIFIGIVVPQLLLALLSFLIIWFGVKKGLAPLDALQNAVSKRSEKNLSPIDIPNVPEEVYLVANSVNNLMKQLQNLILGQNRFIADAAHQLRTPLAGAQAQLELAELETDPAVLKSILLKVHQSLDRLLHTVNQLLILAKSQPEAASTIQMIPLDLNLISKEVAIEMAPTAIQKKIDLGFEPSTISAMIKGNAERLKELLYNLLDNAIRYTQIGGRVTISINVTDADVELIILDNGPGIGATERDKIFDRFHRIIGTGQDGSGLGLAIVKEIAKLHGADITVADESANKGLQVVVSFDREQENLQNIPVPGI